MPSGHASAPAVARTKPCGLSSMMLWPQSGTGTTDTPARVSAAMPLLPPAPGSESASCPTQE